MNMPPRAVPTSGKSGARPARRTGTARRAFWRTATLSVAAMMLALSALLRAGTSVGPAFAQAELPAPVQPEESVDFAATVALLESIRLREAALDAREARLADRLAALELVEQRVTEQLAALEAAEAALARTVERVDGAAEDDVTRLVAVYEAMAPEQAANLFSQMEPEFAAGFVARMQPTAAAAILAGLDPQRAYSISAVLAGRHALAPRD